MEIFTFFIMDSISPEGFVKLGAKTNYSKFISRAFRWSLHV